MAIATSRMYPFLRSAASFYCGFCWQVNSRRIPSWRRYVVNASEKYSFPRSNRRHRTWRSLVFFTSLLNFWKCVHTLLFILMGKIHVYLEKLLMKVTWCRCPPNVVVCAGPHTSEWMFLAELACSTYSIDFLFFKCKESDDYSLWLHPLELLEIDVADSFMS